MITKGLEGGADHIEEIHAQHEGRQARHRSAPAAFIRAIMASGGTQAPKVAGKTCGKASPASREKRLSGWLNNAGDHFRTYLLPAVGAVWMSLARKLLILVIDGAAVGRDCVALVSWGCVLEDIPSHSLDRCGIEVLMGS